MNNSKKKTEALDGSSSEVDDLLRAAEDHLLLDLRLNSHSKSQNPFTSSSSPSIDSDLARRFDALKSPSSSDPSFTPPKKSSPSEEELSGILGDDLAARFAALKGSVGGAAAAAAPDLGLAGVSDGGRFYEESDDDGGRDGDGVSKKEVEKLLQWAKDAARLDPSSKDDDDEIDDDDDDDDVSEDNDDDSDDSEQERINEKKMKSKGKPNRFIFF